MRLNRFTFSRCIALSQVDSVCHDLLWNVIIVSYCHLLSVIIHCLQTTEKTTKKAISTWHSKSQTNTHNTHSLQFTILIKFTIGCSPFLSNTHCSQSYKNYPVHGTHTYMSWKNTNILNCLCDTMDSFFLHHCTSLRMVFYHCKCLLTMRLNEWMIWTDELYAKVATKLRLLLLLLHLCCNWIYYYTELTTTYCFP